MPRGFKEPVRYKHIEKHISSIESFFVRVKKNFYGEMGLAFLMFCFGY
jgi:hypothetical protein